VSRGIVSSVPAPADADAVAVTVAAAADDSGGTGPVVVLDDP
jgi:hypothetical protein